MPGFTPDITLFDFFSALKSDYKEPTGILCGINTSNTQLADETKNYVDMDVNIKANETLIKSDTLLENMGIAVFSQDKLVGELDGMDTLCHLLITNTFHSAVLSFPSPFKENSIVDINILKSKPSRNTVSLVNGTPYIKSKVYLNASILSMDINLDFSSPENLRLLEDYAKSYLKDKIINYLYKTAKDHRSDIVGFGRHLRKKYLTTKEWNNVNWLELYSNSFFDLDVDIEIKNSNLLLKN